ncbi:patatin-like phospholipase family protein [Paraliomyxa miuraensis]|uniref:patatin-like phospholipase family protein n=1 Tax=Paraliomyxa miuraensis TaxID=376150 RepID=UPI00225A6A4B|nr:patatin-like phospholipase family protein [Paraliomyxa miuraensis]MCX4241629.1 patatin-like phospholipase family protein [Paraliomyxa miuraensis]
MVDVKDDVPRVGLVLSGGGARGAYEVGVLRYIREQIKRPCPFHVITGSSVGAINGSYVAATLDRPRAQIRPLARVWSELDLDQMYRFGWSQVRHLPQVLFGRHLPKDGRVETIGGLVDSSYIEDFVRLRIPWKGLRDNIEQGHLHAMACSATELATGKTTVFVQAREGAVPPWPAEPGGEAVPTVITPAHTLASAAIPVLFPAVRVAERYYVDGSLRQNTPVRPAMRLGANRLLVIGLRHENAQTLAQQRAREKARTIFPNAVFMGGKLLDALMLDKLEADLRRIERLNEIIAAGQDLYGTDFGARIGDAIPGRHGRAYVPMEVLLIRPSQNLGEVAHDVIRRSNLSRYSGVMARWIRRSMLGDEMPENDLASYVLFDPDYTKALMHLGYHDAQAQHARIAALFG